MRVIDLERQLSSLSAAMDGFQSKTSVFPQAANKEQSEGHYTTNATPASAGTISTAVNGVNMTSTTVTSAIPVESLDLNTLQADIKSLYLNTFVKVLLPQYPVIAMPEQADIEIFQITKPFTYRAIMTAASSVSAPKSFRALHSCNIAALSQAVVIEGCKSMDLLEALLITATWACPPNNSTNLNIYQWSHMACTMAMELGLGGRSSPQAQAQSVSEFAADPSEAMMEKCRTMLGVYLTCSRSVTPL